MTNTASSLDYNSNVDVFREREYPMLKGKCRPYFVRVNGLSFV
jgi:hypothetical protein